MALSQPRQPTQVVGRYAVYGEIASGGMATIHLGRLNGPVGFSRTVAIKRLHPQYAKDPDFVAMFLDEARLAARIQSPNVVQTMDVVNEGDALFLVMEYVQGESFSRLWRTVTSAGEQLPLPIIGAIVSGMLHGLHAVHEATDENGVPLGIVHRDVSPQNVIVGIDGTARVLDFGVAKAAGAMGNTREGQLKGKLQYMAPEQLSGGPALRTIDIYAAAIVLWEALTGTLLFDGENDARIFQRVLEADAPPPSHLVPEIPEAVDAVVMKGLEKDPARRWQTAREMALALESAIRSAPASEVGPWVEALAVSALGKRAALVRELESSSAVKVPPRALENPPTVPQAFSPMREPMPSVTQALDFSGPDDDDAPTPYHPGKSVLINRPPPANDVVPQPMSLTPLPTAASLPIEAPPVSQGPSSQSGGWPQERVSQVPASQQYLGSNQSGSYAKPVVATAYDPSASLQYNPNASVVVVAQPTSTAMKVLVAIATAALIFAIGAAVIAVRDARLRALALPPEPTAVPAPPPTIQNQVAPEQPSSNPFDDFDRAPSAFPQATATSSAASSATGATSASAAPSASAVDKKNKPKPPPFVGKPRPRPTPVNCNPPTTVDANGIKTLKPECL